MADIPTQFCLPHHTSADARPLAVLLIEGSDLLITRMSQSFSHPSTRLSVFLLNEKWWVDTRAY